MIEQKEELMQSPPNNTGRTADNPGAVSSEIRSDAQQLSTSASDRIHSELDARKGTAAEQAKSVSSAINRAANELDEGVPQWLKQAFQQAAQQVQRIADTLEQKNSRQIMSDIQALARDNPGTFLASCAALGFAAARVFKAGAPESSERESAQTQFPPVQVEEPMFRSSEADVDSSSSRTGEFA